MLTLAKRASATVNSSRSTRFVSPSLDATEEPSAFASGGHELGSARGQAHKCLARDRHHVRLTQVNALGTFQRDAGHANACTGLHGQDLVSERVLTSPRTSLQANGPFPFSE